MSALGSKTDQKKSPKNKKAFTNTRQPFMKTGRRPSYASEGADMHGQAQAVKARQIVKQAYRFIFSGLKSYAGWSFPIWLALTLLTVVSLLLLPEKEMASHGGTMGLGLILLNFVGMVLSVVLCAPITVAVLRNIVLSEDRKPLPFSYYRQGYFQRHILATIALLMVFYPVSLAIEPEQISTGQFSSPVAVLVLIALLVAMTYGAIRLLFWTHLYALGQVGSVLQKSLALTAGRFWKLFGTVLLYILPILGFYIVILIFLMIMANAFHGSMAFLADQNFISLFIFSGITSAYSVLLTYMGAVFIAIAYKAFASMEEM